MSVLKQSPLGECSVLATSQQYVLDHLNTKYICILTASPRHRNYIHAYRQLVASYLLCLLVNFSEFDAVLTTLNKSLQIFHHHLRSANAFRSFNCTHLSLCKHHNIISDTHVGARNQNCSFLGAVHFTVQQHNPIKTTEVAGRTHASDSNVSSPWHRYQ